MSALRDRPPIAEGGSQRGRRTENGRGLTPHPSRDVGRVRARLKSVASELDDILEEASGDGERSTGDVDDGTVAHVRSHLLGTEDRIESDRMLQRR